MRFAVRLTPRGGADRVEGITDGGELRVRVRAAPADGEANRALARLLGELLGISRSDVSIEHGIASRTKRLRVAGVTASDLRARWPGLRAEDLR